MKKVSKIVTFLVLVALASNMLVAAEGDTLVVPAEKEDGTPIVNALVKYVEADTTLDGKQNHDVYRLKRGKYYRYNQMPVFRNPIEIVAYKPGETPETRPPKIMSTTNEDGSINWSAHVLKAYDNVTLKNIAFSTTTKDMGYTWTNIVHMVSSDKNVILEGCHITLSGWGLIQATVENNKLAIKNCHLRNLSNPSGSWCPFLLEIGSNKQDTILIQNTTYFNVNGGLVNGGPNTQIGHFVFDHNTIVNLVRPAIGPNALSDGKITNNIFYNSNTASQRGFELSEYDNALNEGSIIDVDTIDGNEPRASESAEAWMAEKDRKLNVENNCYYWSQEVDELYSKTLDSLAGTIDSVEKFIHPKWMTDRAKTIFEDNETYSNMVANNNINKDPEFTKFGGTDAMINLIFDKYDGNSMGVWGWDPDSAEYPDMHYANLQWPLPEDFSHNLSMKGTDGKPLGSSEYYDGMSAVENNPANGSNSFELKNNYPNPFNPTTTIKYSLKNNMNVKLSIYNVVGQKVKTLVNSTKTPGSHNVQWNGLNEAGQKVSSGIYFYRLKSGSNVKMKKMMLLK